jgi:hypothetical protein
MGAVARLTIAGVLAIRGIESRSSLTQMEPSLGKTEGRTPRLPRSCRSTLDDLVFGWDIFEEDCWRRPDCRRCPLAARFAQKWKIVVAKVFDQRGGLQGPNVKTARTEDSPSGGSDIRVSVRQQARSSRHAWWQHRDLHDRVPAHASIELRARVGRERSIPSSMVYGTPRFARHSYECRPN